MPQRKDLLSSALGSEVDWDHVAPVLKDTYPGSGEYVYFIGEPDSGAIKIGRATHPVKRLRELQTGNPRRLKVERVVYGGHDVERLLHRYWRPYAISGNPRRSDLNAPYRLETEWFSDDARSLILEAADAILQRQQDSDVEESFVDSVSIAMTCLGYEIVSGDTVRHLGRTLGIVETRIRAA